MKPVRVRLCAKKRNSIVMFSISRIRTIRVCSNGNFRHIHRKFTSVGVSIHRDGDAELVTEMLFSQFRPLSNHNQWTNGLISPPSPLIRDTDIPDIYKFSDQQSANVSSMLSRFGQFSLSPSGALLGESTRLTEPEAYQLDSVRRKRYKKMRHHKYRKRLKKTRAHRRKIKQRKENVKREQLEKEEE